MQFGNAPCSWGIFYPDTPPYGPDTYLDEVAAAGFKTTELGPFGFLPRDPERLKAALDQRGLSLVGSVHVHTFSDPDSGPYLMDTLRQLAPLLKSAGAKRLVLMDEGNVYPDDAIGVLSESQWAAAMGMLEHARKMVADEFGLTVSFHPHIATAIEFEAQIDRMLDQTGIALCFDTGHHAFWGQDPLAYMAKVWDRIDYMHLKNVDRAVRQRVLDKELGVRQSFAAGVMCPLPDGVVDIAAVIAFLKDRNFEGPIVVEQDPAEDAAETPGALAKRNHDFLAAIAGDGQ